jgi:TolB protein
VGERDRPGANFPDDHPSFFPDNRRLVFSSNRSNGSNWEIYRMNVDGSGATRLTSSSQEEIEPAWSPDGKQIAFARVQGHSQKDVFVINADGSGLRQVTFADGEDHDATWSSSGDRLAITSERPPFSPPMGNAAASAPATSCSTPTAAG